MDKINSLLAKFQDVIDHPFAQLKKYQEQDKKIIGCAPVYTPEELIHSMDLVPFGLWGADMEIDQAKRYFPSFICSITQTILELGIQGKYHGISAIVIPSLCDSLKCLGENWKYAVPDIPFIPMVYPQNRTSGGAADFVVENYKRVIKDLEETTGKTFKEEALAESIRVYNKHNKLMRRLDELLATTSVITAVQRNAIYKSAFFMLKEEHNEILEELLAELVKKETPLERPVRIITSGILLDHKDFLSILDENGVAIVGDDVASESRQYRVDTDDTAQGLQNLAKKFNHMECCSVLFDPHKKRADLIVDMAKKRNADAVVVVLTKFCDPEEFDFVIIKKACEKNNIPCYQVEVDRQMVNYEQIHTFIQTLSENKI